MRLWRIGTKWKPRCNKQHVGEDGEANSDSEIEGHVSSKRKPSANRHSNQCRSDDESPVRNVIPRRLGKDREMRAPGVKTVGLKRKEQHGGEQNGKRYD